MSSQTEEIKQRLNIVDLIQSYVKLEKAGINFRGRCPFHQEKTPSFFVSPTRQTWRCFGCQKGGDHFSFVQEIEGVEFPDALKSLADRAGVKIVYEDPRLISERNILLKICEEAAQFFEANAKASENLNKASVIMQYLFGRGLTEKTIQDFRIGYALDAWDGLLNHLLKKGFKAENIEKTGLIIRREGYEGRYYDRYRNRIMFPIADSSGRIIGFGGRIFPSATVNQDNEPKYINSPETVLYNKSRVLYAFDRAKSVMREKDFCVVVEGYMDAVMSHQAGLTNTVAVSGTALTQDQLKIISRLTDKIIFSFDMDSAGQSATKRSLDLATQFNFQRKVLLLPSGKDPADSVRENPSTFLQAVQSARPVMEYYFEEAGKRFNLRDPIGKRDAGTFFLPYIRALTNEIERSHWVQQFAGLVSVPDAAVRRELDKMLMPSAFAAREPMKAVPSEKKSRRELLEERLLSLCLANPELVRTEEALYAEPIPFISLHNERFFKELKGEGKITSPELADLHEKLQFQKEFLETQEINIPEEIQLSLRGIFKAHYKEKMDFVDAQIKSLEKGGNRDTIKTLLGEFHSLAERVNKL